MAWEHIITADAHDYTVFDDVSSSGHVTRSTTYKRTGASSFRFHSASNVSVYAKLNVSAAATKFIAFGWAGYDTGESRQPFLDVREADTVHLRLRFHHSIGLLRIYRGEEVALLATVPGIKVLTMQSFDMKFVIHDTEGEVVIRDNNGNVLLNLTGVDTRNGESGVIDNIWFGTSRSATIYGEMYVDDIAVRTDDFCGAGGNHVLAVTDDGDDDAAWTASAGAAWECVDDIPASFTDYISADAGTPNLKATFEAADLGAKLDAVNVVAVYAKARLSEAGAGSMRCIVKSVSSYGNGATENLDTPEEWVKSFFEVDPATTHAWTNNGVNGAQPGVETI